MKIILVLLSVAILSAVIINTRSHPAMTGAEASTMTRLTRTSTQTSDKPRADGPKYSRSAYDITPLPRERVEKLAEKLSPEEAQIILRKGTEAPFCGTLLDNKKQGTYICRLCSLPLFSSEAKFNSGTGWPSFFQPVDRDHIRYIEDRAHGMVRTEILCARCDGHLGHVFDDGPPPTGRRYCLNSASLDFVEKGEDFPAAAQPVQTQTAYFAGGCFWGVEHHFQELPGVINAVSGYQGGSVKNPTYEQVCTGTTNHTETVRVTYDPARISYRQLLENFFRFHDPTQLNRQGPDHGTQYRSAIFAADEKQLAEAKRFLKEQQAEGRWSDREIVTQLATVEEAGRFWEAEEYHQDYHVKHGGACPLP